MRKFLFCRAALLGAGVLTAMAAGSQEPAPTPAMEPAATPAPALLVAVPCVSSPARGFFSRPQVPMPPDLQGDVVLLKTGAIKISGKPPSFMPWVVKELTFSSGPGSWFRAGLTGFNMAFGFESLSVEKGFAFRLVRKDAPDAPAISVRCLWGLASTAGSVSRGSWGIEMKVPRGNATVCELFDSPESEPWRLFLWVGPPSNLVPPEFPSGGGLVRGETRYEATSTNAIKPAILGLKPTMITGTFFTREGRTVAAIERLVPARVLMPCSVPVANQPLFVAIGAALYIRDGEASRYEY